MRWAARASVALASFFVLAAALTACAVTRATPTAVRQAEPAASTFVDCAHAASPPSCILRLSIPHNTEEDDKVLLAEAVMLAGAPEVVAANSALVAQGARDTIRPWDHTIIERRVAARERLMGARDETLAAATAVVAAAQIADDPFAQPDANSLLAAAGKDDATSVATIAATLWVYGGLGYWSEELVRPRGAAKFFRGVIAAPGGEPSVIAELAMAANRLGFLEEARALAAIVVAHPRATPDERSQAVFAADNHQATPREVSEAKRKVDDFCMSGSEFRYRMCRADLGALAAMGGQSELRPLAETFLKHGRDRTAALRARTAAFGLASEAYRLTGNVKTALAAAREGLPLVEKILFEGWKLDGPPERDQADGGGPGVRGRNRAGDRALPRRRAGRGAGNRFPNRLRALQERDCRGRGARSKVDRRSRQLARGRRADRRFDRHAGCGNGETVPRRFAVRDHVLARGGWRRVRRYGARGGSGAWRAVDINERASGVRGGGVGSSRRLRPHRTSVGDVLASLANDCRTRRCRT